MTNEQVLRDRRRGGGPPSGAFTASITSGATAEEDTAPILSSSQPRLTTVEAKIDYQQHCEAAAADMTRSEAPRTSRRHSRRPATA
eukprot:COSAG01_NODE_56888_length_315_cov_2.083333_1_plen_85_part_10